MTAIQSIILVLLIALGFVAAIKIAVAKGSSTAPSALKDIWKKKWTWIVIGILAVSILVYVFRSEITLWFTATGVIICVIAAIVITGLILLYRKGYKKSFKTLLGVTMTSAAIFAIMHYWQSPAVNWKKFQDTTYLLGQTGVDGPLIIAWVLALAAVVVIGWVLYRFALPVFSELWEVTKKLIPFAAVAAVGIILMSASSSLFPNGCSGPADYRMNPTASRNEQSSGDGKGALVKTIRIGPGEVVEVSLPNWNEVTEWPTSNSKEAYVFIPQDGKLVYDDERQLVIPEDTEAWRIVTLKLGSPTETKIPRTERSGVRAYYAQPGVSTTIEIRKNL